MTGDLTQRLRELADDAPHSVSKDRAVPRARRAAAVTMLLGVLTSIILIAGIAFAVTDLRSDERIPPAEGNSATFGRYLVRFDNQSGTAVLEIDALEGSVCYDTSSVPGAARPRPVALTDTKGIETVVDLGSEQGAWRGCTTGLDRDALAQVNAAPEDYGLLVKDSRGSATVAQLERYPGSVLVPDVIGLQVEEATTILEDLGLEVMVQQQGHSTSDVVHDQSPVAGTEVPRGDQVTLLLEKNGQETTSETFALWPSDTRAQAEEECADPDGAAAGGVGFTADPTSIALEFGAQVLGWEDAVAIPLDRTLEQDEGEQEVELRREPDDDAKRARGAAVRISVREVQEDCWFVITVSRLPDNKPTGVGISVNGRDVLIGFDDLGAASAVVEIGHGGRKRTAAWDRGSDNSVERTLHYEPDTSGHFLILFTDENGEVFSANGAPLPAGDFAAG